MLQLPLEVVKLLESAASHPEGEGALFEGHLESVAALYQVHPQTVDQLRACLELPAGQAQAAKIVDRARRSPASVEGAATPTKAPLDLAALIERATAHPDGLELLTHAPTETAAVLLGAHPFVVDAARLHLAARPGRARA